MLEWRKHELTGNVKYLEGPSALDCHPFAVRTKKGRCDPLTKNQWRRKIGMSDHIPCLRQSATKNHQVLSVITQGCAGKGISNEESGRKGIACGGVKYLKLAALVAWIRPRF